MDTRKNNIITVLRIASALAVWILVRYSLVYFVDPVLESRFPEIAVMIFDSVISAYVIAFPIFLAIVWGMEKKISDCPSMKPTPAKLLKLFVIQSGLSFPVMIPVNMIYIMSGKTMPGFTADQLLAHPVFYVFLLLIFAPVVEEMFFRKVILDRLMVMGTVPAVIASAVFFAIPHVFSQGPAQMLYTFVLGLVFAYATVRTKKLWPAMILHSMSNFYGGFLTSLWPKDHPLEMIAFAAIYIMAMPLAAILLTVFGRKEIKTIGVSFRE